MVFGGLFSAEINRILHKSPLLNYNKSRQLAFEYGCFLSRYESSGSKSVQRTLVVEAGFQIRVRIQIFGQVRIRESIRACYEDLGRFSNSRPKSFRKLHRKQIFVQFYQTVQFQCAPQKTQGEPKIRKNSMRKLSFPAFLQPLSQSALKSLTYKLARREPFIPGKFSYLDTKHIRLN